jgi:hypothetical protein
MLPFFLRSLNILFLLVYSSVVKTITSGEDQLAGGTGRPAAVIGYLKPFTASQGK